MFESQSEKLEKCRNGIFAVASFEGSLTPLPSVAAWTQD